MARDAARNYWCLTWNNYSEGDVEFLKEAVEYKYLVIGREKGRKGTPHLQIYFQLAKRQRFSALKKLFPKCHIEAAKGKPEQNVEYCKKQGDFIEIGTVQQNGQLYMMDMVKDLLNGMQPLQMGEKYGDRYIRNEAKIACFANKVRTQQLREEDQKEYTDFQLRPWQEQVIKKLEQQDRRKVLFVVDDIGNSGKSTLSEYLRSTRDDVVLFRNTRAADCYYEFNSERVVLFDLPRTIEEFINYGTIEAFKDKYVTSTKYQSCTKFAKCKVVVFMNFMPDGKKMSADRYDIQTIETLTTFIMSSVEDQ